MHQQPNGYGAIRRAARQPYAAVRWGAACVLLLHFLHSYVSFAIDLPHKGRSLTEYRPNPVDSIESLLVVTLLDGRVVAVRQDSGEVVWTYDTGAPMVTVKQSQTVLPGVRICSGVDGGLYAAAAADAKLERMPITVPELVENSPSHTLDGSLIVGERSSRVYVLDRHSGSLLQMVSGRQGAGLGEPHQGPGHHARFGVEDTPVIPVHDPDRYLVLGREDYLVRSMQLGGNEAWNVTYSRMIPMSPTGHGSPSRVPGGIGASGVLPLFTVGANHTLQAYDPASGIRRWAVPFDTPPVGVFTGLHGDTNFLTPTSLQRQKPRPDAAAGGGDKRTMVLVGELQGSLYALPADHVTLDVGNEPCPQPQLWDVRALPGPAPSAGTARAQLPPASHHHNKALVVHGGGGGSSRSDVVVYATDAELGDGLVSGLACEPHEPPPPDPVRQHGLQVLTEVDEPTGLPRPWLPGGGLSRPTVGANGSYGGGVWPLVAVLSSGAVLPLVLVAAGAGAAAVLVVLQFRGIAVAVGKGGGGAKGDVAAAAAAAGQLDVNAVAGGGGGSGGGSGRVAGRTGGAGQRRRKGRTTGGGGGDGGGGGASATSGDGSLPVIDEDQQLPVREDSFSKGPASVAAPSASSAPHLPSAEARVRVLEDGSLAIGRLVVGLGILGYGSAGTIVYEGVLDGRPVAVKRLLRQFSELARKEIEVLILSDEHPNVVRCFAMEEDREFVYLALERCRSTLCDFLDTPAGREQFVDPDTKQPTPRCAAAMLDVCRGLAALHERGIVHRDLKPHNVLLTEASQRAKLSDMGLSKQLVPEQSSFESHHGPGGSSGWQAPEQLIARDGGAARQTRSMDVFSLGCILYYCMTGGRHPFGDNHYERDANILHSVPSLAPLAAAAGSEAAHLVAACLAKDPGRRPAVPAVLSHPMWWSDERRLSFLVDISDRVENEDREPDTTLLGAMESYASIALAGPGPSAVDGPALAGATTASASGSVYAPSPAFSLLAAGLVPVPNWGTVLPPDLVGNLGRYRRYDFTSLRDLLRVVRNKRNHFREMPQPLQAMLGPLPGGFLRFFTSRFPRLLLAVYVFALQHLAEEPSLQQYWQSEQGGPDSSHSFVQTFLAHYGANLKPVKQPPAAPPQQAGRSADFAPGASAGGEDSGSEGPMTPLPPALASGQNLSGEQQLSPAARTSSGGDCAGSTTSADATSLPAALPSLPPSASPAAPRAAAVAPTTASAAPSAPPAQVVVGYVPCGDDGELHVRDFPRRPGKQQCEFYLKTGHCKFGETCVFDHPETSAVQLTALGLPLRPEEPLCSFYLKTNDCRFGPTCKFHHPVLRPIFAGSAGAAAGEEGGVEGAAAS